MFGRDAALLLDTGSRNGDLAPTLQWTVHQWLKRNSRQSIPLIVVHTHGHSDHVAGDAAIEALGDPAMPVTLIAADVDADRHFFRIARWPTDLGAVDLGDRVIDAIPIPGHSDTSIALYDRKTAILFSGDSLYPGRLYVRDFGDFQASTERLIRFTAGKPVSHILGNHIEQTRTASSTTRSARSISRMSTSSRYRVVPCSNWSKRWCRCRATRRAWRSETSRFGPRRAPMPSGPRVTGHFKRHRKNS
jgi:glyoxylase-like metal-dependent hydrolase (beta-lactamase superfamily II)